MSEPKAAKDAQDDLGILYPEREAQIGGRAIVMREYGFLEGMKLNALIQPLVDGIAALALSDQIPDPDALRPLFAENAEAVVKLIAKACDQPEEWVERLDDEAGRALQLLWWGVNNHFFGRRVLQAVLLDGVKASAGLMSSLPSAAATSTTSASAGSPAAN
jgi:hypothetical protein